MTGELAFAYRPLRAEPKGEFSAAEFDYYMRVSKYPKIINALFLEPLHEKLMDSARDEFVFEGIKVTRSAINKSATRWETAYDTLKKYLDVRADDSRAKDLAGLQKFDGIGYCISVNDVLSAIDKFVEDATSKSSYMQLNWPRMKKGEKYPREIFVPTGKISIAKLDILKPALLARKFCTGIENEVIGAYYEANKLWFKEQTGYDKENPPAKDDSPLSLPRQLGKGSYIAVKMERFQEPDYEAILSALRSDLLAISSGSEQGEFWREYRRKDAKGTLYVNIKRLKDKLDSLYEEKMTPAYGRYEIVPK